MKINWLTPILLFLLSSPANAEQIYFWCVAQGIYQTCSEYGCSSNLVENPGIGSTRSEAISIAVAKCDDHLTSMVAISNISGSASVIQPCEPISCEIVSEEELRKHFQKEVNLHKAAELNCNASVSE